ncbi:MAG: M6 family metalloprotease domain-containing protein [Candidatus Poribacteria bacterium]|nr:M6 family metalloprotease domain-containing protein [Candidatus Poribacteria bacterium]
MESRSANRRISESTNQRIRNYVSRMMHAPSHIMLYTLGIILFAYFIQPGAAAPPNPYRFYDYNAMTDAWTPKPGADTAQFMSALQGCCLAREQGVLQGDGIEFVLAIKIDFSDQPGRRPGAEFDQFFFAEAGVSLQTYFNEVSYGQMDVQPGPAGGVLPKGNNWVRAQKTMGYYGEGRINESRYRELVREACEAVDASVDFSQYDRDNDGVVDHVFVIHSGDDEASTFTGFYGDNIWSILTREVNATFDGVRVSTAVVAAEEPSFDKPHLGIYFHEFFHDFGGPDVYGAGITDSRDHKWGLMGAFGPYQGEFINEAGDGLRPSHIIGYLKWDFDARPENGRLGWIQPVEITENISNLPIPSFALPPREDKLFKIDIPGKVDETGDSVEFFLIENRYRESGAIFDARLPESGILIWHIDETQVRPIFDMDAARQIWLEDPSDPDHIGVDPNNPNFSDIRRVTEGAAYSADDNQISFTPATRPNSNASDGTVSGIAITNIGPEGQTMQISVSFGDTYEPNDDLATAFPIEFGQTYESFIFDGADVRDVYRFDAIRNEAIVIMFTAPPEMVDYRLALLDANGRKIVDGEKVGPTEQRIIYQPEETGLLHISVESQFGFSDVDSYRLTVDAVQIQSGVLKLAQIRVFPNPVRAEHTEAIFSYTIPDFQRAEQVELEIFNIAGDLVHTDVRQSVIGSSQFRWTGASNQGEAVANGIYIYVISARQGEETVREIGKVGVVR